MRFENFEFNVSSKELGLLLVVSHVEIFLCNKLLQMQIVILCAASYSCNDLKAWCHSILVTSQSPKLHYHFIESNQLTANPNQRV